MESKLKEDTTNLIDKALSYCKEAGLETVFTYELSDDLLDIISERSKALPSMYFVNRDTYKDRLKNGCYLIKKGDEIVGHIFAHKHTVYKFGVYERTSLWVHPDYRKHNLGLLLMHLLTQHYNSEFLISIAQEPAVHQNNQSLGMIHIPLSALSPVIIETLEEIGKLRDEVKYKYYVNPYFESKIKQINKILNRVNKTNKGDE